MFDETVTLDASLRQVAGTLGYSDPLYTRSRLSIFPGCYSYCIHISMCVYLCVRILYRCLDRTGVISESSECYSFGQAQLFDFDTCEYIIGVSKNRGTPKMDGL